MKAARSNSERHGRWPWSHRYVVVGLSYYDSITGPLTIMQGLCSCGRRDSWTERGRWSTDQVNRRLEVVEPQ